MAPSLYSLAPLVVLVTVTLAETNYTCPAGWSLYKQDQTCLKVFGKKYKWQQPWSPARVRCEENYGGDLVQIFDDNKNRFVSDLVRAGRIYIGVWIGIKNNARSGQLFQYINGSSLGDFHPWRQDYPVDNVRTEYKTCVQLQSGKWANRGCYIKRAYVCSQPLINTRTINRWGYRDLWVRRQ